MTTDGQVAMVTGAARGIGAAIARALSAGGARVALCDIDFTASAETAKELGPPAIAVKLDVSSSSEVASAIDTIRRQLGPVELLVNNAGIDRVGPFIESDEDDWDRVIAVNLRGPIICCKAVLPEMIAAGRGRIVNIASDAGKVGSTGEAVYSATKGGIIAFTKTLARETARSGITVNCVCPGPTDTDLLGQVAAANPRLHESLARAIPMRRLGQPADIAAMVAFLLGDGASFITGQAISVSGGLTMS